MVFFGSVLLALACVALVSADGDGKGRGFGDSYEWKTSEEAFSADNDKPIMVIVHRTWCGACKNLAPKFASSSDIQELAPKFTMLNFDESDDPGKWQYDGGYIPRVLFLTPKGEDMSHIINASGNPKYKYYYTDPSQIVTSMKQALKEVEEMASKAADAAGEGEAEAKSNDAEEENKEGGDEGEGEAQQEEEKEEEETVAKDEL